MDYDCSYDNVEQIRIDEIEAPTRDKNMESEKKLNLKSDNDFPINCNEEENENTELLIKKDISFITSYVEKTGGRREDELLKNLKSKWNYAKFANYLGMITVSNVLYIHIDGLLVTALFSEERASAQSDLTTFFYFGRAFGAGFA